MLGNEKNEKQFHESNKRRGKPDYQNSILESQKQMKEQNSKI